VFVPDTASVLGDDLAPAATLLAARGYKEITVTNDFRRMGVHVHAKGELVLAPR
jgi:hypothetical protein